MNFMFTFEYVYLKDDKWTMLCLLLFGLIFLSSGGVCWKTFNSTSGLCQKAIYLNTTSEDCCITKGIASLAWSPHESSGDIFYFNFLSGGADQCHRCHSE